ncbi:MAG: RND family transporter [Gammaproteobacteria bacterium]|nr:RND family transporter [Gammaproteobacteria bacterium]MBQ0775495.1 RND family transporter [Gammaproteobacteria bacterium]
MTSMIYNAYRHLVLRHPGVWLILITLISAAAGYQLQGFHLDASSESLVLENDQALDYYRTISKRYGGSDFLVVAYTPKEGELFTKKALQQLDALHSDLKTVEQIDSVYSVLDVPLLFSPPTSFSALAQGYRTLRDEDVDLDMARAEFIQENPVYKGMLVSPDGNTTALLIRLNRDEEYFTLLNQRDALTEAVKSGDTSDDTQQALLHAKQAYSEYNTQRQNAQAEMIAQVRAVVRYHDDNAQMFLGGVPMIATDMIGYVRSDLQTFGLGVLLFILISLLVIFRQPRWAVLSLLCCAVATLWLSGLIGTLGWKVTIISSNYVSLMLIITMSITIHLIVRFRELQKEHPDKDQTWLTNETVRLMARPSIYMILTTMVGFSSLVFSDIRPVIDFGLMMTIGIGTSLLLCYLLFPAFLKHLKPAPIDQGNDFTQSLTLGFATVTEKFSKAALAIALCIGVIALVGMTQLTVENRFIDYFQKDTEIHQGMVLIDQKLGGTTPLDIIIDAPVQEARAGNAIDASDDGFSDDGFSDDGFSDDSFGDSFSEGDFDGGFETNSNVPEKSLADAYWYTPQRLEQLVEIQQWLSDMPETGKVLSLATTYETAEKLNNGPLSYVQLMLLSSFIPEDLRNQLVQPYLSDDGNQIRISVRIIDSNKELNRDALLKKIESEIVEKFDLQPEQVHLTGAMVLYNNLLQSLFDSQIKTMGLVFVAIFVMLLVLLRSLPIALISMAPSILSAGLILGIMGWIGLPLDMMTITIAAITVGIAVDDSIHYIHRYREEFPHDNDYVAAMKRCHASIGKAMYYTSITIIAGFSILTLSNFNPTVYFGVLTGLAMLMALLCNLTLLPALLITFRPKIPALN